MADGFKVADAYLELHADAKGLPSEVSKEVTKGSGVFAKMGTIAGGIIGAQVLNAAGRGIKALFGTGFSEYMDATTLNAQLEAGLKSTGNAAGVTVGQMNALASSIQGYSGQTDDSIAGAQSLLLTFTNIKNVGADKIFDQATVAAANMAARMGGDASSKAVMLGKALNDPVAGIASLTRVGVQFTDQQKEQIKTMVASGDVIGAQKVILGELETQFGGSAAAAGQTFSGTLQRIKRSFEDITQSVVGGFMPFVLPALHMVADVMAKLAPHIQEVTNKISEMAKNGASVGEMFQSAIGGIGDWLSSGGAQTIIDGIMTMREKLFNAAVIVFNGLVEALPVMIPKILTGLTTMVLTAVSTLVAAAPAILNGAVQLFTGLVRGLANVLPSIIQAIVDLLPDLVSTLVELVPGLLDGAVEMFNALVDAVVLILPVLLQAILDMLPSIVSAVLEMLPDILNSAIALFQAIVDAIPIILPVLMDAIVKMLPKILKSVLSMLPDIIKGAVELFNGLVKAIPMILPPLMKAILDLLPQILKSIVDLIPSLMDGASTLWNAIIDAIPTIIDALIPAIAGLLPVIIGTLLGMIPDLIRAGVDLIGGLVKGLWNAGAHVGAALLSIAKSAIKGFLAFLGIHSPSKLFAGFGDNIGAGLAKGIDGSGKLVGKAMDGLSALTADSFDSTIGLNAAVQPFSTVAPAAFGRPGTQSGGDTFHVTLDVSKIQDVSKVIELMKAIKQTARQSGGAAVAF